MSLLKHHAKIETNALFLTVGIFLTVIIGGIVEIVPLFTIESTIEKVEGVRPYTPLELAGRNIYIREGCYNCHSQMVRPFRDEMERYGHYSLAAESMYDHPFQWASKRTGPDLARVGGKYSNDWHRRHLINPRDVVPESIMPGYPHLLRDALAFPDAAAHMKTLDLVGVPYSEIDGAYDNAVADFEAQANPDADHTALLARYPKAVVGDFDGQPGTITEMDALIAYLQVLGTMVDFTQFDPAKANAIR
ncbi:cytochrome-c oxidase, cbb3-type subunit II [Rhodospirillum rubrum]|uniref:cytochrome-c oxidase, cbb3-type subunit II n=1 Tax=Rhodospirillum rubrum TaxID=1085 RepID=UPI0019089804|nr:cytochrome-c oxidase, cbb3-type subunit II [Rhodospirillum rubrum]MBK1664510.1 cytochrome-c oxidase, cbb3-type subunit II [Rhodospirillum rubrum]MBK1676235.1 cytochrome-c oxidase, cbb3-type subunit II [Rhodospirillum rubrum]